MIEKFCYIEPGGMTTIEASEAKDHGVYIEIQASSHDEDVSVLSHLPPDKARELAAWLLERYGLKHSEYVPDAGTESIINELAAIADACADLHQNRNRANGDPIMQWDNAKLTLGTVRKARWLRDGRISGPLRTPEDS